MEQKEYPELWGDDSYDWQQDVIDTHYKVWLTAVKWERDTNEDKS